MTELMTITEFDQDNSIFDFNEEGDIRLPDSSETLLNAILEIESLINEVEEMVEAGEHLTSAEVSLINSLPELFERVLSANSKSVQIQQDSRYSFGRTPLLARSRRVDL